MAIIPMILECNFKTWSKYRKSIKVLSIKYLPDGTKFWSLSTPYSLSYYVCLDVENWWPLNLDLLKALLSRQLMLHVPKISKAAAMTLSAWARAPNLTKKPSVQPIGLTFKFSKSMQPKLNVGDWVAHGSSKLFIRHNAWNEGIPR